MNRGACVSKTGDLCDFHPDCPGGEDERLPMCCKFSLSLFLIKIPRMRAMRKVMMAINEIDVYPISYIYPISYTHPSLKWI